MTGPLLACGIDLLISLFLIGALADRSSYKRDWFVALTPRKEDAVVATIGVAAIGMLPLSLPRSIGFLAYSSFLSLAGFSLLVIVLAAYGLQCHLARAPERWHPQLPIKCDQQLVVYGVVARQL